LCANYIQAQELITIKDVEFDANTGTITRYLSDKTEIEIPATFTIGDVDYNVEKIGYNAFSDNKANGDIKISQLVLPSGLKSIDQHAFANNNLTAITIPASVISIGGGAFNNNAITKINGVDTPGFIFKRNSDGSEDNTTIVSYGGTSTEIDNSNFPATVSNIDNYAFYKCAISKVVLPNKVTRIGYSAFNRCSITHLTLPTEPQANLIIDDYAFMYNQIQSLSIPAAIEKIGYGTFYRNSISTLNFPDKINSKMAIGDFAFSYNPLPSLILPEGITSLGKQCFQNNVLESVTLPNTLINIEAYAFTGNQFTTAIPLPASPVKEGYQFSEWENWDGQTVTEINNFSTSYSAVFIKEGATTISLDDVNFNKDTKTITGYTGSATKIQIPNYFEIDGENIAVSKIGAEAFYGKNLTQVILPNSIHFNTIDEMAFENNQITEIDFPEFVSNIGQCAFNNNQITKVNGKASNGLIYRRTSRGEDNTTIVSYGGTSDIINFIPENVKILGSFAFSRNDITSVTIPANVLTINHSFNDNIINSVNGEASKGIVYAHNNDGTVDKTTVASYGGAADEITADFFASEVTNIAPYAFSENGLTAIELPNSITKIGIAAFGLNEISGTLTLPQGLELIEENAFAENDISAVSLPNTVTEIRAYAFDSNNTALTNIELKDVVKDGFTFIEWQNKNAETVTSINDFTLAYKAILKEAAHIITIDDIEFDKSTGTIIRYFAYYTNIEIPSTIDEVNVQTIKDEAFASKNITNVKFPESLFEIGSLAFFNNQLQEIVIPDNIGRIQPGAFNKNAIKRVNNSISNGIIYNRHSNGQIDINSIASYGGISKNINFISNDVNYIGSKAFYNCGIESLEIPASVYTIDVSAFAFNKIHTITFNEGIETIHDNALLNNHLTNVVLPNSLKEIGASAFENNRLNNITFGDQINNIGARAFAYNYFSNDIVLPNLIDNEDGDKFSTWVDSNDNEVSTINDYFLAYHAIFTKATEISKEPEAEFLLYPNPTNNVLNIKWSEQITGIEIYSLSGNKVYQRYAANNELAEPVNVSQLKPGIYIIKVKSTNKEKVQRIVIR
jgi:hypothetical protein